jgi:hypothetical protein|tara:strand:+ start:6903 stop:7097 length:195 start_codon:yes stop_codon:yes gene_type:complete
MNKTYNIVSEKYMEEKVDAGNSNLLESLAKAEILSPSSKSKDDSCIACDRCDVCDISCNSLPRP